MHGRNHSRLEHNVNRALQGYDNIRSKVGEVDNDLSNLDAIFRLFEIIIALNDITYV